MGVGEAPRGLRCPGCGAGLRPTGEPAPGDEGHRLLCPDCGETFRARRRRDEPAGGVRPRRPVEPKPVGEFSLRLRSMAVRALSRGYPLGVTLGAMLMIPLGGFVPVLRGWLRDEVADWNGVVEALGGVRVVDETRDPDADLGPVLARLDAPTLFQEVNGVARRLGVRPPEEIRLAYLPCCGVVAWRRSRILLIGLPLFQVLDGRRAPGRPGARAGAPGPGGRDPLGRGLSVRGRAWGQSIERIGRAGSGRPAGGSGLRACHRLAGRLEAHRSPAARRPAPIGTAAAIAGGGDRGLGPGQGRDGPADLPRGPRPPRPRPRRPPQPLRPVPRPLEAHPQRGPRDDAAPRPGQQRRPIRATPPIPVLPRPTRRPSRPTPRAARPRRRPPPPPRP